jgi:hypothetical protein
MSNVTPLPPCGYSDNTDRRILAFLASMQPLSGGGGESDGFHRGRSIIERMAISAKGTEPPSIWLQTDHCADVLEFLAHVEPLEPSGWWDDPEDSPSHTVGLQFVLRTLAANLREAKEAQS